MRDFNVTNFTRYLKRHFLTVTFVSALLLVLCWYGVRFCIGLYVFNDTFNVTLASDAKTQEYLGEVVSEVRDPQTGKVVSYRIRPSGGGIIDRQADSVIVFKP